MHFKLFAMYISNYCNKFFIFICKIDFLYCQNFFIINLPPIEAGNIDKNMPRAVIKPQIVMLIIQPFVKAK
jgi:hypothetical protein